MGIIDLNTIHSIVAKLFNCLCHYCVNLCLLPKRFTLTNHIKINHILSMPNTAKMTEKHGSNMPDPIITDLNMAYVMELAKGKTQTQVAKEFGVTPSAVNQQIKKVNKLLNLKEIGEIDDPVNACRARLTSKLAKGEKVIDYALRPKIYRQSPTYLGIAKDFTLSMLKGLGVLADDTKPQTINIEDKRIQVIAKLDMADQFGTSAPAELREVKAELIEERPESVTTAVKQPVNSDPTTTQDTPDQPDPAQ